MKFALVGIGKWGQTYIKTLKQIPDAQLIATCSRSGNENLPDDLKIAPHYNDLPYLLAREDVDTVIVATHPDSHFDLSYIALQESKHVICEKPFMFEDYQVFGLRSIMKDRIFYTDYTNLFHKVIEQMRSYISLRPITISLVNMGNGPIRQNYSALWDYGSHVFSVIYDLFSQEKLSITSASIIREGNYYVDLLSCNEVRILVLFGNKSPSREHSFGLNVYEQNRMTQEIFWRNDKSENPLKIMLEKFIKGELSSNIDLSLKIQKTLLEVNKHFNFAS